MAARGDSVKIESIQFQAEDFSESEKLITIKKNNINANPNNPHLNND